MAIHSDYDYGIKDTKDNTRQLKKETHDKKADNVLKSNTLKRLFAWFRKKFR